MMATSVHQVDQPVPAANTVIRCEHITRYFGGVQALEDVSLTLRSGEVLCLVGDNGAGKSTLTNIITGQLRPDDGRLWIDGVERSRLTPRKALELGVSVVPQTLELCDNLDATQNVMLAHEPIRLRLGPFRFIDTLRARQEALGRLRELGYQGLNPRLPVRSLSGGQRQAVAIVRAMVMGTKAIIFDEPTAALGVRQTEDTLQLIKHVAARQIGVLMVSHTLPDVMAVADRIVALRHGSVIMDKPAFDVTEEELAEAMAFRTKR
jgi:ABC-type sugar transport system ATPase subunit